MKISGGTREEKQQAADLVKIIENQYLTQFIMEPIRGSNILDLLLSNSHGLIHPCDVNESIMSDHKLIKVRVSINNQAVMNNTTKSSVSEESLGDFNFYSKEINWEQIKTELKGTNWKNMLEGKDTNDILKTLITRCQNVCHKHVPKKSKRGKKRQIPRDRRILMKKRQNLQSKMKETSYLPLKTKFRKSISNIERKLQISHDEQQKREELQAVANIQGNSKFFFSYANKKLKSMSAVGPLTNNHGDQTGDPKEMADTLKTQYENVFSSPKTDKIVSDPLNFFDDAQNTPQQLAYITISEEEIIAAIDTIGPDSAAGPDGFHAQFLKQCKQELATPLQYLWSKSLETGIILEALKVGIITPIHKGGNKGMASKYRPLVITSHLIKICERVVKIKMINFFEINKIFNPGQHGFRQGRSCLSQLLLHYEKILEKIQEGQNADVIYLDFGKAFDKVDHGILLHKLKEQGITGPLGRWLHCFLSGRLQRVSVQGSLSEPSKVQSGVPQGSVLGPLLFIIHIGDIDAKLQHSKATSFADDTRVMKQISMAEDTNLLQQDLNKILNWATENNMALNGEKFELLRYGNKEEIISSTNYCCDGQLIQEQDHVKDLGIFMSRDVSFTHNIAKIMETARKMSGWILRTFNTRDKKSMLTLWKSLVFPRVEYCCQLWSPHKIKAITTLEAPQRTFTSRIQGIQHLNYWERLSHLKLYSLQRRRERYIIIYIWKILEGRAPNVGIQENDQPRRGRLCYVKTTQGNTQKVKTLTHQHLHLQRDSPLQLPQQLRDLKEVSPDNFKRKLDRWLSNTPDHPPTPGYTGSNHNTLPDVTQG